jgi:hypothetical protein
MAKRASDDDVKKAFFEAVNLSAKELRDWLETDASKSVGVDAGDGQSVGRKSGARILLILKKKRAALTPDDVKHMRKVVGFVRRHCAQGPRKNVETSRWRYALMNWGHDPLKPSAKDAPWL